jgi:hypothetical protein
MATDRSLVVLWNSPARAFVFSAFFVVAFSSAITLSVHGALSGSEPLRAAFRLFDLHPVIWLAAAAGLVLLTEIPGEGRRSDAALLGIVALLVLAPVGWASWLAVTLIGAALVVTSRPGSVGARAGWIIAALSVPKFWAAAVVMLIGPTLLALDAAMVSALTGAARDGNTLLLAEGETPVVVFWACSSFHDVSLMALAFITYTRYFAIPSRMTDIAWVLAGCVGVAAINILRLAAMVSWPDWFDVIHTGFGAEIASIASLTWMFAICRIGAGPPRPEQRPKRSTNEDRRRKGAASVIVGVLAFALSGAAVASKTTSAALQDRAAVEPLIVAPKLGPFLADEGFILDSADFGDFGLATMAQSGACVLTILTSDPRGQTAHRLKALEGVHETVMFLYGGQVMTEQPVLRTTVRNQIEGVLYAFGLGDAPAPVLALFRARTCTPDQAPPQALAEAAR